MRSTPPVLVIGATGRVGGLVVEELLHLDVPVRALTRRPEGEAKVPEGAEVVTGDLAVPESLDAALVGVDTVFLVWTAPPGSVPAVLNLLVERTRRVVFLTGTDPAHAGIERRLTHSEREWTILRPGALASDTLRWAPDIRAGREIRWDGGVAAAPVDDRDVAAVAARALSQEGHVGRDYVLTGPEALTPAEQAGIIGEVLHRPLKFVDLTPADPGHPGRPAHISSDVADVLGRARTYREWVRDHAHAF